MTALTIPQPVAQSSILGRSLLGLVERSSQREPRHPTERAFTAKAGFPGNGLLVDAALPLRPGPSATPERTLV